jgi:hypothetical protein
MSTKLPFLHGWMPQKLFAAKLREKTGTDYPSDRALDRWRREGRIPTRLEWDYFGRAVMWREKPEN